MSEKLNNVEVEKKPDWEVEDFYFGLGEWSTYRRDGERVQYKVERTLPLTLREGTHQYDASADTVAEFLTKLQDCQFTVADSYELNDGGRQEPYLWVQGWADLTDEQKHVYEQEKAQAWKKPDQEYVSKVLTS